MWLLYQDTGEEKYAGIARSSERKMEKCFADYYGLHHDVGFMFLPTAVTDYRLNAHNCSQNHTRPSPVLWSRKNLPHTPVRRGF